MTEKKKACRGFSLIELLIVVAIILIIAAIAIPNFMRSRMAANEAAAVSYLRAITTAATIYSSSYGNGYPPSLGALGPPAAPPATCDNADVIDSLLAGGMGGASMTGQKSGYIMTYAVANPVPVAAAGCSVAGVNTYTVNGNPVQPGASGTRYFFTNQSGIIRFNTAAPATVADQPLE